MSAAQKNVFSFPSKSKTESIWYNSDDHDSIISASQQSIAVYGSSVSPPKTIFIESGARTEEFAYIAANGGSGGGGMEARLAKLEATVSHIQSDLTDIKQDIRDFRKESKEDFASIRNEFSTIRDKAEKDFRLTFTVMAGLAIGLLSLIAKAFGWIS